MDSVDKFIDGIGKLAQAAQSGFKRLFWSDFSRKELPEPILEQVHMQPEEVQQYFMVEYEERANKLKGKRNFAFFGAIFFLIAGGLPITLGLLAYLWHLKENGASKLGNKALKKSLLHHGLLGSSNKKMLYKIQRERQKNMLHRKGNYVQPKADSFNNQNAPIKPVRFKEPVFDPTNLNIETMELGYLVDYNFSTWEVRNINRYEWDNNTHEKEYQLTNIASNKEIIYVYISSNKLISVCKLSNIHSIDTNLEAQISHHGTPYNILSFKEKSYYKESPKTGIVYNTSNQGTQGSRITVWDFYDGTQEEFIKIEQLNKNSFRALVGMQISEGDFSAILPKPR